MNADLRAAFVLAVVALLMIIEARRSAANERWLRAEGAIEPDGDVYQIMQPAYPGAFLAMSVEGLLNGIASRRWFVLGAMLFVIAKALKYWAIQTLGPRWSFRVLVLPSRPLVKSGPYRFLQHPNYVAVLGEIAAMALMMAAPITGTISVAGFGALILRRIGLEEKALGIK